MIKSRVLPALISLVLALGALAAQDGASDAIHIDTIESIVQYREQTGKVVQHFYVYINDFARNASQVAKLRINDANGTGWDINLKTYRSDSGGYFGGMGSWESTRLGDDQGGVAHLGNTAVLTLNDGTKVEKSFLVDAPRRGALAFPALFIYSPGYRGLVTHLHQAVLAPPKLSSLWQSEGWLHLRFSVKDQVVARGKLYIGDPEGKELLNLPFQLADGSWAPWLNQGKGLLIDGRTNEVELSLAGLVTSNGAALSSPTCVWLTVSDDRKAERYRSKRDYLHWTTGRSWLIATDADTAPRPMIPASPAAAPAAADPGENPWTTVARELWEDNLPSLLLSMNSEPFGQLLVAPDGADGTAYAARGLDSDWGITDHDSLVSLVRRYLDGGGHSLRFTAYAEQIKANPGKSDAELAAANSEQNLSEYGFRFSRYYLPLVGARSLLGWDLGRVARICRAGFQAGYLSQDEARYWLYLCGQQARQNFASWTDWGVNYQIGRMFWGGPEAEERLFIQTQAAMSRLAQPDSALNRTPWPRTASAPR